MLINLKVKTLDSQTHEFSVDNEITIREFKDKVAEKTNVAADQQRIIYCGRVMVDDKQLKDYDVDGKVVHVAERPPPSHRTATPESSTGTNTNNNERRHRGRAFVGNMRNSPLFRALDGMVVGTMAFPVNPNANGQAQVNPLTASSSFCMNRITVARHMLDCANNIAAFLEDPSRSLDILARGRWTMESTVVEVGITSEIPPTQQFVEMVQGAMQAALRRSGNTNVTLLQLPIDGAAAPAAVEEATPAAAETQDNSTPAPAMVEDVLDDDEDDDTPTNDQSVDSSNATTTEAGEGGGDEASAAADGGGANDARRRTGTRILAGVIEQMRNVQTRLNPFIDQYYEMLQNEPSFEEDDASGRENAQRLFDRVSEALHYMSHAQHAISDLMLDVSQPSPRFLTCRPILVEQSGYVSSNNFITPAMIPGTIRHHQHTNTPRRNQATTYMEAAPSTANGVNVAAAAASTPNNSDASNANNTVEDPVDEAPTIILGTSRDAADNTGDTTSSADDNIAGGNLQRQMARLIQDVVSAAHFDTEFHVHIDSPNVVSIDVPIRAATLATMDEQQTNDSGAGDADASASAPAAAAANDNAVNVSTTTTPPSSTSAADNANPARVTTATLPTTSTQTRSTSRPQVHIGNIPVLGMPPGWNGRVLPANNNVSSFDRFLPCNSHHVRDLEAASNGQAADNRNGAAGVNNNDGSPVVGRSNRVGSPIRPIRTANLAVPGRHSLPPNLTLHTTQSQPNLRHLLERSRINVSNSNTHPHLNERWIINLHQQLRDFIQIIVFEGKPINEENTTLAINRAVQWFDRSLTFLPQFEKPEFDSRASLTNVVRAMLPGVISLTNRSHVVMSDFERRLKVFCESVRLRMFSVLMVCIGRPNTEIFWNQLMRLLQEPVQSAFPSEVVRFLTIYLSPNLPNTTDEADAQQFIVHRSAPDNSSDNNGDMPQPMETDIEMTDDIAGTSQPEVDDEPLPEVTRNPLTWHRHFPDDWLPIITRDQHRMAEARARPPQPPFSDAYLSGMSSKRRKLVQHLKPPTEVTALIADTVGQAISNSGIGPSTSTNESHKPEDIARLIANDTTVQSSYTDAVRANLRDRLKNDPDYAPEKYPKTAKFIQK